MQILGGNFSYLGGGGGGGGEGEVEHLVGEAFPPPLDEPLTVHTTHYNYTHAWKNQVCCMHNHAITNYTITIASMHTAAINFHMRA